MSDFPHWPVLPTGDVFYVKGRIGWRNLRRADFCEDGPYLITGMHIDNSGQVDWDACFHIPQQKFDESPEIQVEVGDLVITKDGTIGKVGRIDWLPGDTSLNSHLFLVRPVEPKRCSSRFAFHVFSSPSFHQFIENQKSGSTLAGLGEAKFVKFDFPVPDFSEQELVSAILDTLDTTIRETEAIIAKLKAVKQGLLHDLLTRGLDDNGELRPPQSEAPHLYKQSPLGWIPKEWPIKKLEDLADVNRGKFTHRPRNDPKFLGGSYPFIQTGDVAAAQGEYISTFSQTLSELGVCVSQEFPAGTIAITIAANIADTAILAVPMYFPDSVVGAIVHDDQNVRFVELSIRRAKKLLDARAPQSAQKNINLQDLRPLLVATPHRAEQDAIAARYDTLQAQLESEQQTMGKLVKAKSGLMDDLLTGRVRVTPLLNDPPETSPEAAP